MVKKITMWLYLEPFLYTKEYLHLADISKKLNKPHPTVRKYLNLFEKLGILVKTIKGRLTLYKLNINNKNILDYLVLAEKEKLVNEFERNPLLKEIVSFLYYNLDENNKALIFGSAVNNMKRANDVDLLITGKINLEDKLKNFENNFGIKIHLINAESLKKINETLKTEIIKKHLIIKGSEEIVKWLI